MKTVCPYCKKEEIPSSKKKTCGSLQCQATHHKKLVSEWWRVKGKVYNGKRKAVVNEKNV